MGNNGGGLIPIILKSKEHGTTHKLKIRESCNIIRKSLNQVKGLKLFFYDCKFKKENKYCQDKNYFT
jgi:hypothetical protein